MEAKFIDLKNDRRMDVMSWPAVAAFIAVFTPTAYFFGKDLGLMIVVVMIIELVACAILFHRDPVESLFGLMFFTRESTFTPGHEEKDVIDDLSELKPLREGIEKS